MEPKVKAKVATITFNNEVTQDEVDHLIDQINTLMALENITAVILVEEQEVSDGEA